MRRPTLDDLNLPAGKKARLYDIMYNHGARNGTLLLPIDHGLEHGPIDFFTNPEAADPDFHFELAVRGGYNGIACQIGFAERHWLRWAGQVPLILRDSLYAVDYAARASMELGADVVKVNIPKKSEKDSLMPRAYRELEWDYAEGIRRVVRSAGNSLVVISGGSKLGDEDLLEKARLGMEAGAAGLIFGRNTWQRPMEKALEIGARVKELFAGYGA